MLRYCLSLFLLATSTQTVSANEVSSFLHKEETPYSVAASVHPDASLAFTKSFEGNGSTFEKQAESSLSQLEESLNAVGLKMADVVNVRAYIKSAKGDEMAEQMSAWNAAFTKAFSERPAPPSRTTIGVSRLAEEEALIAIDAVIAAPQSSIQGLEPSSANPRILANTDTRAETIRAAAPFSSLLITSGVLADPIAEGGSHFGDMSQQTLSVMKKLEEALQQWGLNAGDLLFVRVLLSPDPGEEAPSLDLDGYTAGWSQFWNSKRVPTPPVSVFAAPGFSATGRLIEVEFYAAFPDSAGPFLRTPDPEDDTMPVAIRHGRTTSFLSSSVAIARDATLTWFSGAISHDRDNIYGQGVECLLNLEESYSKLGIDISDTIQLRAYLNLTGPFRSEFGKWNRAYRRFFDHAKLNPLKPVRTAFPIENLPGELEIEIETIAASRD